MHWGETSVREVVFALLPRVILLDLAGPADAFRNANTKVPDSYRLRFVAPSPKLDAAIAANAALGLMGLTLSFPWMADIVADQFRAPAEEEKPRKKEQPEK